MLAYFQLIPESYQPVVFILLVVFCWEALKRVFGKVRGSKADGPQKQEWLLGTEDFPEFEIPAHPHAELALDPPTGLICSNPSAAYPFENDFCTGKLIYFHPPTIPGVDQEYADYFKGKKRRWELRLQLQFKKPPAPDAELCFGIELDRYEALSATTKHVISISVAAMRTAVGAVYQTPGDDPDVVSGEVEKPGCVLPLWAFDQFIVTPEGRVPPSLKDPNFPNLGQKRYQRVSEFVKELEATKKTFDSTSVYTFAFWGNSRFLDVINWQLMGIPMVTPLDFDSIGGAAPCWAVLYNLRPDPEDKARGRHVQSRKQYFFRAALWSSMRRPEKKRFEALTGASNFSEPFLKGGQRGEYKSIRRRVTSALTKSLACCVQPRGTDKSDMSPEPVRR